MEGPVDLTDFVEILSQDEQVTLLQCLVQRLDNDHIVYAINEFLESHDRIAVCNAIDLARMP